MKLDKPKLNADIALLNIGNLLTMDSLDKDNPLGKIPDGAVLLKNGKIIFVGSTKELFNKYSINTAHWCYLKKQTVMPGWIDCHSHVVFDGNRLFEFALRSSGVSYQDIAMRGGGIVRTVQATRNSDEEMLFRLSYNRLSKLIEKGITTSEIKSGYGLSFADEVRLLSIINKLNKNHLVDVVPTFLGAHTIPVEYKNNRAKYIDILINEMIPHISEENLAVFCDIFCEQVAFSIDESRIILESAKKYGLKLKLHAEQLSRSGATLLGVQLGATSVDHLEHVNDEDLTALAGSTTIPVLLPSAACFLGQEFPNAKRFFDHGLLVAIATDFNPGSSPTLDLPLVGTIAITRMGFSVENTLLAVTKNPAKALGLSEKCGMIKEGYNADISIFSTIDPSEIFYSMGENLCEAVIKDGKFAFNKVGYNKIFS